MMLDNINKANPVVDCGLWVVCYVYQCITISYSQLSFDIEPLEPYNLFFFTKKKIYLCIFTERPPTKCNDSPLSNHTISIIKTRWACMVVGSFYIHNTHISRFVIGNGVVSERKMNKWNIKPIDIIKLKYFPLQHSLNGFTLKCILYWGACCFEYAAFKLNQNKNILLNNVIKPVQKICFVSKTKWQRSTKICKHTENEKQNQQQRQQ